jgi:hypothetical protein
VQGGGEPSLSVFVARCGPGPPDRQRAVPFRGKDPKGEVVAT